MRIRRTALNIPHRPNKPICYWSSSSLLVYVRDHEYPWELFRNDLPLPMEFQQQSTSFHMNLLGAIP